VNGSLAKAAGFCLSVKDIDFIDAKRQIYLAQSHEPLCDVVARLLSLNLFRL